MKFGLGAILICLLLIPAAPALAEGPRIVLESGDFDFGSVYAGRKVEHTFRFKNSGDQPLMIERVRSSCGCTAALLSSTVIGPGDVGEVKSTFDSTRFGGNVAKTIYLYSNDPLQKVTQLHIRGLVKRELLLNPERVDLKTLEPGATKVARVSLTNQGAEVLDLKEIQVTARELTAELSVSRLAPGEAAEVVIKATPPQGKTRLSGYVIVKTSSSNTPELRIPVYGAVAVPAASQ